MVTIVKIMDRRIICILKAWQAPQTKLQWGCEFYCDLDIKEEEEKDESDQSLLQGFQGKGGDDGGGEAVSCVRWRSIRSKPEEGQRRWRRWRKWRRKETRVVKEMKEERSSDKMRRIVVRFRSCFNGGDWMCEKALGPNCKGDCQSWIEWCLKSDWFCRVLAANRLHCMTSGHWPPNHWKGSVNFQWSMF